MPELSTTPKNRSFGVIVTAESDDGRMRSFHHPGASMTALELCCDDIELLGPGWRIVSVSTPRSIFRDLQGTRRKLAPKGTGNDLGSKTKRDGTPRSQHEDPRTMENNTLSKIGALHLLKPLPHRFVVETVSLGVKRTGREGKRPV